jgi:hypothetical protein
MLRSLGLKLLWTVEQVPIVCSVGQKITILLHSVKNHHSGHKSLPSMTATSNPHFHNLILIPISHLRLGT